MCIELGEKKQVSFILFLETTSVVSPVSGHIFRAKPRSAMTQEDWVIQVFKKWLVNNRSSQRPPIWVLTPMNPYDGFREMFQRMCLTPGAWYMTVGRFGEW